MKTNEPPTRGDIDAAVQAGKDAAAIVDRHVMIGGVPVGLGINGEIRVLSDVFAALENRQDAPQRRRGTATLTELDSFVAHVNRAKRPESVIFAHGCKLSAVYNYYPAEGETAAWADHIAYYSCPLSEEWRAWSATSGTALSQDELAELLDERNGDIFDDEDPAVAKRIELIALTTDLQIHTKGTFTKKLDRTTGAHEMICKTEHGENSTRIPGRFKLRLPVFVGGTYYEIFARLQLRIRDGHPAFVYTLQHAAEVKRQAFDEVREVVAAQTGLPVFAGSPEA
jgi:uncharacterized protein YfdQ (DUF2303 family)